MTGPLTWVWFDDDSDEVAWQEDELTLPGSGSDTAHDGNGEDDEWPW